MHGDISGQHTWDRSGWKNPIDWFQTFTVPQLIRKEILEFSENNCAIAKNDNFNNYNGNNVIFIQRLSTYRHFFNPEIFLNKLPFSMNQSVNIVTFEGETLCKQVKTMSEADVIIAPHGR